MDSENAIFRFIFIRLTSLLFLGAFVLFGTASAEIPVSTAIDGQFLPWVVDDGEGGVVVMWEDYRTGKDWDVYAQRVDSTGKTGLGTQRYSHIYSRQESTPFTG